MELKLVSHINADSDLVEAWLKYYIQLGIAHFHLIVHGPHEENQTLLGLKEKYPISIEASYEGPFDSDQKKSRLDAVLACHPDQWLILVDSDEFVEFPYHDIPETIRQLERSGANVMAAPMLQRLTSDGSLESPAMIDDPFRSFPLCSEDLYRRVGLIADIFKFPLFFCVNGTRVLEEGNHNPPLGTAPIFSGIVGVTHHFKFRRTVLTRLDKRINSEHAFKQESIQLRAYLDRHSGRLPLEGTFRYSRSELFHRGLLKQSPQVSTSCLKTAVSAAAEQGECSALDSEVQEVPIETQEPSRIGALSAIKKIAFVLPPGSQHQGIKKHVVDIAQKLSESQIQTVIICFNPESAGTALDPKNFRGARIQYENEPTSLLGWVRILRKTDPTEVVFCHDWLEAFGPTALMAALVAGARRRFAIQYLMPIPVQPPVPVSSLRNLLRRIAGKRVQRLIKIRIAGWMTTRTICTCRSVRDALVHEYGFPSKQTITVYEGISTSHFKPCGANGAALRARLGIGREECLLICVARLAEEKGLDILIHALSRVLRQGIRCKCVILGAGPLKEQLTRKMNSLGLPNFVRFEGYQDDIRPYLQGGSAFVLTSLFEGFPVSVLEAMACGLPCIVTDVGGIAEIVSHGRVGIVIPPGSVEEAEKAIVDIVTHPSERAAMAAQTREVVCRSFNLDQRIEELKSALLA